MRCAARHSNVLHKVSLPAYIALLRVCADRKRGSLAGHILVGRADAIHSPTLLRAVLCYVSRMASATQLCSKL